MEEMEESFVFGCPICGKEVEAPRSVIGMQAECPGCDSQITVPDPDRPAEEDEEMSFDLTDIEEGKSRTTKIDIPDAPDLRTPVKRKIVFKRL